MCLPTAVKSFLIFSLGSAVRGIPFFRSAQEDVMVPLTNSLSFFVGIDFDAQERAIFYSDTSRNIIYKQKIDGTGEKVHFVCMYVHIWPVFKNTTNALGNTL